MSLYALSLERLLHQADQTQYSRRSRQRSYTQRLLTETLKDVHRLTEPSSFVPQQFDFTNSATDRILEYIRDERNDFWHPVKKHNTSSASLQTAINPNLVAFRAISSLILMRMAEVTNVPLHNRLLSYVAAVEHWCSNLPAMYDSSPDDAVGGFETLWCRYYTRVVRA